MLARRLTVSRVGLIDFGTGRPVRRNLSCRPQAHVKARLSQALAGPDDFHNGETSLYPQKGDMVQRGHDFRFAPIADIGTGLDAIVISRFLIAEGTR
jgi:hypothetical protein